MKRNLLTLLFAAFTMAVFAQFESAPAFPGAEGHGRFTTGGRGTTSCTVVHVTNLNDSGAGSFREAVTTAGNRIVVFDVAGVIALRSDLTFRDNITILGQTAPYPGITLRYYTVQPGNNNIIRYIRFRRGEEKDVNDGADACWQRNKSNIIFDHCSFSWSIDEVASFYDNNCFTMQWCTVAESLTNPGHNKGAHGYGGIWGGKLASFHHNMIAHVSNRGPRFNGARYKWTGYTANKKYSEYKWANYVEAENVDFRNCLMYDAQGTCYGGPGGGQINIVNNYFKGGASGRGNEDVITTVSVGNTGNSTPTDMEGMTSRYYISGNTTHTNSGTVTSNRDWKGVKYDSGVYTSGSDYYSADKSNYYKSVEHKTIDGVSCVPIKMTEPCPAGYVTTHQAIYAYSKILQYVGASLYRDEVDERYIRETKTNTCEYQGTVTGKWGLVDFVSDVKGYTEETFPTGKREADFDTDGDGIPDTWELSYGLNPNDKSDGTAYSLDPKGYYRNIEVYANSIVEDIVRGERADAVSSFDEYFPDLTTGIENIVNTDLVAPQRGRFNLQGQRVNADQKGIVIENGRKVIVK